MLRNPRDVVIQACSQSGMEIPSDYFSYKTLAEGGCDKKRVKELKDLLQNKSKNLNLRKAYQLFLNWNNRIQLEGLLFSFTPPQLSKELKINLEVLEAYSLYFFNTEDFKDLDSQAVFIELIQTETITSWFADCSVRSLEDIVYRLTGKASTEVDLKQSLRQLYNRAERTAHTFLTTDTKALAKYAQLGIFANEKSLFEVGLKATDAAVKIATLLLRHPDQDKENFLASWNIDVEREPASLFEPQLPKEIEAQIRFSINEVSPIKRVDFKSFDQADEEFLGE